MMQDTWVRKGHCALGCLGLFALAASANVYGCGGTSGDVLGPAAGSAGSAGSLEGGTDTGTDGAKPDASNCQAPTALCGNQCVDTRYDPSNCGKCGTKCGTGEVCSASKCGVGCGGGTTLCGNKCVETQNDPANCGACGFACPGGQLCSAGKCGSECSGGTTKCGESCVDVKVDPGHCGNCTTSCAAGQVCSNGQCGVSCSGGTTLCDSVCTNTQIDPSHCGNCTTACPPGQVCSAGQCGMNCVGGTTLCGTICTNTQFDPNNCGTCGNVCPAGEGCSSGGCSSICSGNMILCSGVCTNPQFDTANCGSCGNACATGQVCSAGACGSICSGGTTLCGAVCTNTQFDPSNCGSCNHPCAAGEVCSAGTCNVQCQGGTTLCGTACVDTHLDPAHCGNCTTTCPAGQVCSAGLCSLQCGPGTTQCGSTCTSTLTDPANCGTCGNACPSGQYCAAGTCTATTGCAPLTKCGLNCVDTTTDANNCGTCGTVCPAGAKCVSSACVQCDSTTTDCDGDGWKAADGDCCDKPGVCGADPFLVNPGAIEVIGNGIDDNCNGKADLFDIQDTVACDSALVSNSAVATDYAKAIGICRSTTENPPLNQKTWGLISAQILRADGSPLGDARALSIRGSFGSITPATTEGTRVAVLSSGIAADAVQTNPGPNGGAPSGANVSTTHSPGSSVNIQTCTLPGCIKDWYAAPNPPMKAANALPNAPGCTAGNSATANDSVMLLLRMRAPTNAKAFSFNSFFLSAEYPEYVCTDFNDQFVALVDTPAGTPSPIPNPPDKNLMTYTAGNQKWPIGINIAHGTTLFSVCDANSMTATCTGTSVTTGSCSLGASLLTGTGFEIPTAGTCLIGGGSFWLTTAGNVIPGQIVELRIVVWDVADAVFDSLAIIDGFQWLANATLPGTG